MGQQYGIAWTIPPAVLGRRALALETPIRVRLAKRLQGFAARLQAEMHAGAPWTDRTGATRASLTARAQVSATSGIISLSVGPAPGSPWVEIANQGRYAIVGPTLASASGRVMGEIGDLL